MIVYALGEVVHVISLTPDGGSAFHGDIVAVFAKLSGERRYVAEQEETGRLYVLTVRPDGVILGEPAGS